MKDVYVVFAGFIPRAVYSNLEEAKALVRRWVEEDPDLEYVIEEWPLNVPRTRFNTMIVALFD